MRKKISQSNNCEGRSFRTKAGKASLISVVKIQKKIKRKKGKIQEIINAAQATPHTSVETLPPTQNWASISGSVPCWVSHMGVSTAKAALRAQKAALGSNQLSTETLTTLVSDLTFHFPKFRLYVLSLITLVYTECIRSSSELQGLVQSFKQAPV